MGGKNAAKLSRGKILMIKKKTLEKSGNFKICSIYKLRKIG